MRARFALTLFLLLAASALAWWLLRPGVGPVGDADEIAADGPAMAGEADAGLGAGEVRPKKKEEHATPGRCAIFGTARRMGVPIAARIEIFALARAGVGLPLEWRQEGLDSDLPAGGVIGAVPYASTASGAEGTFRVSPMEPGEYDVVAVAPDGARGSARVNLNADGAVAEANPDIHGGPESLSGRTMKADGTPWKGHVAAQPSTPGGEVSAYALTFVATGDDGRFTLRGLDKGRVSVIAFVDKAVRIVFRPVPVPYPAGELVLVVDADFREIAGRVVDDRDARPLSGASVASSAWSVGERSQVKTRTTTDAEGRFKLPVPQKSVWVGATLVGYGPAGRNVGEGQAELELRLVKTARVTGRVTSEVDGAPVGGVSVYAVALSEDVSAGARGVSGPDGRYEIAEVRAGSVMVGAFGGGWYSKDLLHARTQGFNALAITVAPDGTATVDLVVSRGTTAAGKVLAAGGKPVPGATVGWTGAPAGGSTLYDFDWVTLSSRAATAEDGTFAADTLVPGFQYRFTASAPGQTEGAVGPLEAEAGKTLAVEIQLPEGRWLDATVLDGDGGKPVAGAVVQCWFNSSAGNNTTSSGTGPDGKARVGPLPPGQLWAIAYAPGSRGGNWQQIGKGDGSDGPLDVTLTVTRARDIRGHLKYTDGAPVDDRNVYLTLTGSNTNWNTSGMLDAGAFEFSGVADGSYRLEVKIDQSQPAIVGVTITAGDENVVLAVPGMPAKRVALTIVDGNGKPVPAAKLLYSGTESGSNGDTAYEGKFRLAAIATEGWVEVYMPAGPAGNSVPWAAVSVGPIPEGTESKEIKLEAERRIEGFVHGPDGRGVRGVRIRALPVERAKAFEGNEAAHDATLSDAEGRFALGRLWGGDYKLLVEASDTYAPSEPRIVASGSMSVDVALLSGFVAALPVQDWQGRPLAKATVTATIEGRQNVRAVTDAAGVARLVGLDRTRLYRLDVEPPGEVPEAMSLSVAEWKPSDEPVRVARAFSIKGVVRDREGRAVGGAHVTLVSAVSGDDGSAQTGGEGVFDFSRLAPGDYRLFATSGGETKRTSAVVTVTAGGADVALVLDPAVEVVVRIAGWPAREGETWVPLRFDGTSTALEWARVEAGGVLTFHHLHPDSTYAIYLRLDSDSSRIVCRRGISASTGEVRAVLESGRSIRGRLVAPRGTQEMNVSVSQDGIDVAAEVDAEGRYEMKGLPDGTYRLHASGTVDGAPITGIADVTAGGTADIELKGK